MAFSGLLALLDDIATIADDVATLTYLAAKKTTGVVTDDMAVTAEQTIGIQREREIPVVLAVAKGSLFNKCLFLAPGALVLNAVAPWTITPILMAGGAFLCFEGVEKLAHKLLPHHDADHDGIDDHDEPFAALTPEELERQRVAGAVRTDFILSGEIIAISLGEVATAAFFTQAAVLYAISLVMTVGVYGLVAVLIKMDDVGEAMVLRGGGQQALGKLIVAAAPKILHVISWVGTVAMLLVGGHILMEGIGPLHHAVEHYVHELHNPALEWVVETLAGLLVGLVAGSILVGVMMTGVPAKLWAKRPWGKAA